MGTDETTRAGHCHGAVSRGYGRHSVLISSLKRPSSLSNSGYRSIRMSIYMYIFTTVILTSSCYNEAVICTSSLECNFGISIYAFTHETIEDATRPILKRKSSAPPQLRKPRGAGLNFRTGAIVRRLLSVHSFVFLFTAATPQAGTMVDLLSYAQRPNVDSSISVLAPSKRLQRRDFASASASTSVHRGAPVLKEVLRHVIPQIAK